MSTPKTPPRRRRTSRAQWWNYGWDATYFITICTYNRQHHFGEITDGIMHLSPQGHFANDFWYEITDHAQHVILDEFVVMPNHIHGIIILQGNENNVRENDEETRRKFLHAQREYSDDFDINESPETTSNEPDSSNPRQDVGTGHALSLRPVGDLKNQDEMPPTNHKIPPADLRTIGQQRFQNIGKNTISSIIGGYKSAVTKHARRGGHEMAWQVRFHDHIIRDEKEFHYIAEYIRNNVANWKDDRFYKE